MAIDFAGLNSGERQPLDIREWEARDVAPDRWTLHIPLPTSPRALTFQQWQRCYTPVLLTEAPPAVGELVCATGESCLGRSFAITAGSRQFLDITSLYLCRIIACIIRTAPPQPHHGLPRCSIKKGMKLPLNWGRNTTVPILTFVLSCDVGLDICYNV